MWSAQLVYRHEIHMSTKSADHLDHRIIYWSLLFVSAMRWSVYPVGFNPLRPGQNSRHFADDTFKRIFLNENLWILIMIWLKFVPKGPISNISALVQIMAWRRPGDKPLSEPMMVSLLTHIYVARPHGATPVKPLSLSSKASVNRGHEPICV